MQSSGSLEGEGGTNLGALIANNTASNAGGGVYVNANGFVWLGDVWITQSSADNFGGGTTSAWSAAVP